MMKWMPYVLAITMLLSFCKKKNSADNISPEIPLSDTAVTLASVTKIDVNEFRAVYQLKPRANEVYKSVFLVWSTSPDFLQQADSLLINNNVTSSLSGNVNVTGLQQKKNYYFRMALQFNGKRHVSGTLSGMTDSLQVSFISFAVQNCLSHNDTLRIRTNLEYTPVPPVVMPQVYLGQVPCTVTKSTGLDIYFKVPGDLAPAKYKLKLSVKNMTIELMDSVEVMFGNWREVNTAPYPVNPYTTQTGLIGFGNVSTSQKGYIVGGSFFNGYDLSDPRESMHHTSLYEFDLQSNNWTIRPLNNKKYLENPICFYYNNSIYVLGGIETIYTWLGSFWDGHRILQKTMKRLDLSDNTWYEMGPLPYPSIFNMVSFELNGEFYVGNGADSAVRINGDAQPSNKFWKFNPATNIWTSVADYPGTGYQINPKGFSLGSYGYVFYNAIPLGSVFSTIATQFRSEFWRYDPQNNSWTQIPQSPDLYPPYGEKYEVVTRDGKAYFISSQKYSLGVAFYYFAMQNVCQEYDPLTNTFRRVALMRVPNLVQFLGNWGNKYYFHSGTHGYFEAFPNITYCFTFE